jgi:hypothetical protein
MYSNNECLEKINENHKSVASFHQTINNMAHNEAENYQDKLAEKKNNKEDNNCRTFSMIRSAHALLSSVRAALNTCESARALCTTTV